MENNGFSNQKKTDGMAIASLVCGICGIVSMAMPFVYIIGIVPSILGIIFGNISKNNIARNPNLEGMGMAKAGFICGVIGTVLAFVGFVSCGVLINSFSNSFSDL